MNKYLILYNDDNNITKDPRYEKYTYTQEIVESTDVKSLMCHLTEEHMGEKRCAFLKKAFDDCVKMEDYVDVFNSFAHTLIHDIFVISSTLYSEP